MNNPTEKDFSLAEQSINDLTVTCRKQEEELARLRALLADLVGDFPGGVCSSALDAARDELRDE